MIQKISSKLAQQIAETVKDVCGQDINFIDTNGMIFASTDETRIGDFHEIGLQVATTGTTIEVHEEDAYHGTKDGINIPVFHNGKIISVIGISGQPDEVRKFANLAIRITKLLVREHEMDAFNRSEKQKQNYLVRALTKDEQPHWEYLLPALSAYGFNEKSSLKVVVLRLNERYNIINLPLIEQKIYELLERCEFPIYTFDFPNEYVALLPESQYTQAESVLRQYSDEYAGILRIGIGNSQSIYQLKESYQFCEIAIRCTQYEHQNIITFDDLDLGIIIGSMDRKYKQLYCEKTIAELSAEDLELLLVYYEENMSLSKTCERLFLHKNTLQYRLDRIHRTCGYNPRIFRDAVILYLALKLDAHE